MVSRIVALVICLAACLTCAASCSRTAPASEREKLEATLDPSLASLESLTPHSVDELSDIIEIDIPLDGSEPTADVLVKIASGKAPPTIAGATFNSQHVANIYSARVAISALKKLALAPEVERIEASHRFAKEEPPGGPVDGNVVYLDGGGPSPDGGRAFLDDGGNTAVTSAGGAMDAVVGIIEALPVDPCNKAFLDSSGQSRVESIDILQDDGQYQSVPVEREVAQKCPTPAYWDTTGHATAVAGVAAGREIGRAPEGFRPSAAANAKILSVTIREREGIADIDVALARLKVRARGRPLVVNCSLGTFYGARDGTSLSEQMITRRLGPGFAFVAPVGNEGSLPRHAMGGLALPSDELFVGSANLKNAGTYFIEVWWDKSEDFDIEFKLKAGRALNPIVQLTSELATALHRGRLFAFANLGGQQRIFTMTVTKRGDGVSLFGWHAYSTRNLLFLQPPNSPVTHVTPNYTAAMPSSAIGAIRVTGYTTIERWVSDGAVQSRRGVLGDISPESSRGPTLDGRPPLLSAPYTAIAPASTHCDICNSGTRLTSDYEMVSGTSFAAPAVAGVVAAIFNIDPTNFPNSLLRRNAQKDQFYYAMGDDAPYAWGAGKLDAQATLEALRSAIAAHPTPPAIRLNARFTGQIAHFSTQITDPGQEPQASEPSIHLYLWRLAGDGDNTSVTNEGEATFDYTSFQPGKAVRAEVVMVNSFGRTGVGHVDLNVP